MLRSSYALLLAVVGLVVICAPPVAAQAQDVNLFEVVRTEYFTQATTNPPATGAAMFHALSAFLVPAYGGSVVSVALHSPDGSTIAMTNMGSFFALPVIPGQTEALPGPAHAGTYQFQVAGAAGQQKLNVSLPGPATGIPPVRVANFDQAQVLDATQPFELQWDHVVRRGSADFLSLDVIASDGTRVFNASNISLDDTSVTIPSASLPPNSTNVAYLSLHHYMAHSTGARPPHWLSNEHKVTRFKIKTLNPAGVLAFSPICITANETDRVVTITVARSQGRQGTVTVDYLSTDGTAHANVNYAPVSGTLTFPSGETNQSFTVPLANDDAAEPPLTVEFSLTNATGGAGLAVRPHATLTLLDSQSAPGQNVNAYLLANVEFYSQTNSAAPIQSSLSVSSRFYASVRPRFPGGAINASLTLPDGTSRRLESILANYQCPLEYQADFPSKASMMKTFRSGKYLLNFDTLSDGSFSAQLNLGVERSFSVPHLTNWVEAQTIDPLAPFTMNWEPFLGATTNDWVEVRVEDAAGEYIVYTPDEWMPGALPGTTRSFTIPAGTLEYGSRYFVNVIFAKVTSPAVHQYPAIRAGVATVHTTGFFIHTKPTPSG